MPSLSKLYAAFKNKGLVVVGIDVGEKIEPVTRYISKYKISYPILLDTDGKVGNAYRVRVHPDHFLIGRQGQIIGRTLGHRNWMSEKTQRLIQDLLNSHQDSETGAKKQNQPQSP